MAKKLIQNRYRILGDLGKGGMGSVFKAEDTQSPGKLIALKRIGLGNGGFDKLPYLRHEFKTLIELHHPNLGEVYDFGAIPEQKEWFFTSEYIEGVDLLQAVGSLSWDDLLDVVVQICHALEYIHSRDIVHHDVKPRNILVRMDEESHPTAKIVDFGLSSQAAAPAAGRIRGTVHYLAPEIIRGDPVDGRADLYSLGATLYHVVTGRPPFEGDTSISVIRQHLHDTPTPPGELKPGLPDTIGNLLLHLLAKSPADRLQSANEVIREINRTSSRRYPLEPEEAAGTLLRGCFVGRAEEVEALSRILGSRIGQERPQDGTTLVLLEAEAGMGKSRFLREFQVRCQVDGIMFLHGASHEEGDKSLGPLGEVISQLLPLLEAIEPHRDEEPSRGKTVDRYAAELSRVAPDFSSPHVQLPLPFTETEEEKLTFLERLARFFLEALEGAPAVICLSNLHWAREATIEFLEYLTGMAGDARFLLIGSYRPEEARKGPGKEILERLAERDDTHLIRLGGIDRDEVALLVRSILGTGAIPDGLIDHLMQATGGNPFFIEEMMKQLAEAGTLEYRQGRWVLHREEGARVAIPIGIREMIVNRIGRCSAPDRDILEVLAALERPTTPEILAGIGGFDPQGLLPELRSLERQGLLSREASEGGPRFSIAHTILREITYQRMDRARRKEIHGRIAERLMGDGGNPPRGNLEVLAHHLLRGPYPARSVPFLIAAGDRSRWLHADEAAIRFYSEALTILGEDDPITSLQLLEVLGRLYQRVGRYGPAIDSQQRMIDLARLHGDRTALGRAHLRIAEIQRLKGEFGEAEAHAGDALLTFREVDELEEITKALAAIGSIHWSRGDPEKARESLEECLKVHRRIGDPAGVADALGHLGLIQRARGAYDEAYECLQESLRLREEAGDSPGKAASVIAMGQILRARGEYAPALDAYRQSLAIRREIGDPLGVASSLEWIGRVHCDRGQYTLALQACAESLKIRARVGNRPGIARALTRIGEVYLALSDIPVAIHFQGQALAAAREIGDRRLEAGILCEAGLSRLRTENTDEARDLLSQARETAEAAGAREVVGMAECGLARIELIEGRAEEASGRGAEIIAAGESIQSPRLAAQGRMLRGESSLQLGRKEAAEEDLQEAVRIAEKLGDPEIQWRASHAAGRVAVRGERLDEAGRHYLRALLAVEGVANSLGEDMRETYLSDRRKGLFREDALSLRAMLGP